MSRLTPTRPFTAGTPGSNRQSQDNGRHGGTPSFTPATLREQNLTYAETGGLSEENRGAGFAPAFLDTETGSIYLSRFRSGWPAPVHILDGLPDELVIARRSTGAVSAIKPTVTAGFVRHHLFYTREEAALDMQARAL